MKLTIKTLAIACVILGTAISSCKKEPTEVAGPPSLTPNATQTKTELLTDKTWKVTARTINPAIDYNGVMTTDFYAIMTACQKDNTLTYNTNGTCAWDEGATLCTPTDLQTKYGTWSFYLSETKIITTTTTVSNGTSYTSSDTTNLETLNSTTLTFNGTFTSGATNYAWTETYTKQ